MPTPSSRPSAAERLLGRRKGELRLVDTETPPPAPATLPVPPEHLDEIARQEWARVGALLLQRDGVGELDVAALAIYCQAYSRWVQAEQQIAQFGTVLRGGNGLPYTSPYVKIANEATRQLERMIALLGLRE